MRIPALDLRAAILKASTDYLDFSPLQLNASMKPRKFYGSLCIAKSEDNFSRLDDVTVSEITTEHFSAFTTGQRACAFRRLRIFQFFECYSPNQVEVLPH